MAVSLPDIAREIASLKRMLRQGIPTPRQYRLKDLETVTGLSKSQLERWDRSHFIPGRKVRGRIVAFLAEEIHQWIDRGMPLVRQK